MKSVELALVDCRAVHTWSSVDALPGVYAGLLAALLATALRRYFDGPSLRALAIFAAVVLILLGPVLFGGQILLPLDNLRGHVPFTQLPPTTPHGNLLQGDLIELVAPALLSARSDLLAGVWPLWTTIGTGMPLLADPQAQALQPLALAVLPFAPLRSAGILAALRIWIALLFTYALLRAQGCAESVATAGALAFGLGGFLILWLGWPIANAAAVLPAVLYATVRLDRPGGRRDLLLFILATACLWLAGHPETIVWVTLLAALFLLDRIRLRASDRLALVRRAAIGVGVSLALAAPAILPAIRYLPQSLRAERLAQGASGTTMAEAALSSEQSPRIGRDDLTHRWLEIVAPNAFGNSRYVDYWGLANTNEDASGFVGTAAILAALLALFARRRLPQENIAWLGVAASLLVLALPLKAGSGWVGELLANRRILLLLAFCLAYIAACTWERWRRGEGSPLAVLATAVTLAALLAWSYLTHRHPIDPDRLAVLRLGWLNWQERILVASTLLLLAPRRFRPPAAWGLAALVGLELLLAHRPANPPSPPRLAFPASPALGYLFAHRWEGRMAALGRALPPNLSTMYGLPDARMYSPVAPAAYLRFANPIVTEWWGELPLFGAPENPLYARLGIRHLLTQPGLVLPRPWHLVFGDDTAWIYQQPTIVPPYALARASSTQLEWPPVRGETCSLRVLTKPAAETRHLVTSQFQDGGWRLLVDRRLQPSALAGPFLAADVPAGSRRLDLLYRPTAFLLGCLLAALATGALAALTIPPPVACPRSPGVATRMQG